MNPTWDQRKEEKEEENHGEKGLVELKMHYLEWKMWGTLS